MFWTNGYLLLVKVIFTQMTSDLQKIIAILNILIPMRKKMLSKW